MTTEDLKGVNSDSAYAHALISGQNEGDYNNCPVKWRQHVELEMKRLFQWKSIIQQNGTNWSLSILQEVKKDESLKN